MQVPDKRRRFAKTLFSALIVAAALFIPLATRVTAAAQCAPRLKQSEAQYKVPEVPQSVFSHIRNTGYASWYGSQFHGRRTANGEEFDQHEFTAAHPTLPFGTKAKITNLKNHRSVVVHINDRGPFAKGRMVDLSMAAARQIGIIRAGIALVRIEVLPSG